ncbi:heme/hemin ABC transporter substrate-binding protein [Cellulomonas oligotrophica]|uniref:Iron complex transport system substrate-binding protein n=1 Tax=Cellulomonas oligotrophica TaxID=931536 RepID=A0A7Y9JYA0_9CELL|nr:ABC transporter substrate-binding protein [Cellulomonas oligotrophica]NYD87603.1 iron complex transport system substrate-binding protein [Cellulomonas oligotrophica]
MRAAATWRRLVRAAAALTTTAALAACSTLGGAAGPVADGGARLADVSPVVDPRAVEGPSTAVVADAAVRPVADDPQPQLPASVVDVQGTSVTVTDVSRILALDVYGTLSRTVFELGLGANVVGRDVSSGFAEIADRPLVTTGGHDLSAEAILELAPTVVVTDTTLGPWDAVLQVRDAGVPVVVVDPHRDVATVGDLVQQVADALGVPAQGEELAQRARAEIDAKIAEIAAVAPADPADRLRIMFLYARGQAGVYYLFGEGSGADSLVDSVGGVDVAGEIGWEGMRPLTDEGLVTAAPDVILMMTDGLESVGGVDGLLERLPAVASTPAGERRRVVDMADSQVLSFGPATADVLDALAVALYAPGQDDA